MKKLWTEHQNKVLIAGSCLILIFMIGAVIYGNVPKTEKVKKKGSTASQTVQKQKKDNTVTKQEPTQAVVTETPKEGETEHSVTEESDAKAGEKKQQKSEVSQEKNEETEDLVKQNSENEEDKKGEQSKEKKEEPKAKKEVSQTPNQKVVEEAKENYVPISEGWKDTKSAKGEITSAQKAALDAMVEIWKSGSLSDSELKANIMEYLEEQKITCTEVSVTSQGYALYDQVPKIELSDGGNYYSFVGTYSTGKQNPDGTDKTIFYNWSVFVF
ncbi:MAG: hypothetical protein LBN31_13485 [Hungatella sp.]|jgi:hypothetical protein|nr:hypothetical protein [Hungatella sp.]